MLTESTSGRLGWQAVLLTDGETDWYGDDYAVERRQWQPLNVTFSAHGCGTEEEVIAAAGAADVVVSISVRVPLTGRVIATLDRCRGIVRAGVGFNNIDLEAAIERGLIVCNVPDYCTTDVADHTVALILSLVRRVPFLDQFVRSGGWQYSVQFTGPVPRLSTLVLGLVGFGRIAREVALRMEGRVKAILAYDPYVAQTAAGRYGVQLEPLGTLLDCADILSLHLPLTSETRHLIGPAELERVKPSAVLVNTSRGAVVDELALAQALQAGRLACAGLDVLAEEPLSPANPLASLSNVLFTPHFAGYSESAKHDLRQGVARAVSDLLLGYRPKHILNPAVRPRFRLQRRPPGGTQT